MSDALVQALLDALRALPPLECPRCDGVMRVFLLYADDDEQAATASCEDCSAQIRYNRRCGCWHTEFEDDDKEEADPRQDDAVPP